MRNDKYVLELIAENCTSMRDYLNLMTIDKTTWEHAKKCTYSVYKAKQRFTTTEYVVGGKVIARKIKDYRLNPSHIEVYFDNMCESYVKPLVLCPSTCDIISDILQRAVNLVLHGEVDFYLENTFEYTAKFKYGECVDVIHHIEREPPIRTPDDELYSNTDGMEFHF